MILIGKLTSEKFYKLWEDKVSRLNLPNANLERLFIKYKYDENYNIWANIPIIYKEYPFPQNSSYLQRFFKYLEIQNQLINFYRELLLIK